MERLECDRCGREYTDTPSIEFAKTNYPIWVVLCALGCRKARGLSPCPVPHCPGEMILRTEEATIGAGIFVVPYSPSRN